MNEEELFNEWLKIQGLEEVEPLEYRESFLDNINLTEGLPRTPVEIKKDIKHAKNPMQLKQLNQELNKSYKCWKKRKGH